MYPHVNIAQKLTTLCQSKTEASPSRHYRRIRRSGLSNLVTIVKIHFIRTSKILMTIPHVKREVNESGRGATFGSGLAIFVDLRILAFAQTEARTENTGWFHNTARSMWDAPKG